jgi:hypothetical protein
MRTRSFSAAALAVVAAAACIEAAACGGGANPGPSSEDDAAPPSDRQKPDDAGVRVERPDGRDGGADADVAPPPPGARSARIASANGKVCRIAADGRVRCTGARRGAPVRTLTGLTAKAVALAAGYDSICILQHDGRVACLGSGLLGDGSTRAAPGVDEPVFVTGIGDAEAVTPGDGQHCARSKTRGWLCWGKNGYGQLLDGTKQDRPTPAAAIGLGVDVVEIVHGSRHVCVRSIDGKVRCAGGNDRGQLGDGTQAARDDLTDVKLPARAIALSAATCDVCFTGAVTTGGRTTCATLEDGAVACWGDDALGQADGAPSTRPITRPVVLPSVKAADGMLWTQYAGTCVTDAAGALTCWGSRYVGVNGAGAQTVSAGGPIAEVTGTAFVPCFLRRDDVVACGGTYDSLYAITPVEGL